MKLEEAIAKLGETALEIKAERDRYEQALLTIKAVTNSDWPDKTPAQHMADTAHELAKEAFFIAMTNEEMALVLEAEEQSHICDMIRLAKKANADSPDYHEAKCKAVACKAGADALRALQWRPIEGAPTCASFIGGKWIDEGPGNGLAWVSGACHSIETAQAVGYTHWYQRPELPAPPKEGVSINELEKREMTDPTCKHSLQVPDINKLDALRAAASTATWQAAISFLAKRPIVVDPKGDAELGNWMMAQCPWTEIAEYIAAMHNAWPAISKELRNMQQLAADNDRLRRALGDIVEFCDDPDGSEKGESLACGLARLLPAVRVLITEVQK